MLQRGYNYCFLLTRKQLSGSYISMLTLMKINFILFVFGERAFLIAGPFDYNSLPQK